MQKTKRSFPGLPLYLSWSRKPLVTKCIENFRIISVSTELLIEVILCIKINKNLRTIDAKEFFIDYSSSSSLS